MLSDGYANTLSREGPDDDSAVMEGVGHSQRVGSGGKPHEVSLGLGDAPSLVPQACRERVAALGDLGYPLEQLVACVEARQGRLFSVGGDREQRFAALARLSLRAASNTRG